MDQNNPTQHENEPLNDLTCLSTSYNTLTVTISESAFTAVTDFCFRVKTEEEFGKLEYLIRNPIKLNVLIVLDRENGERLTQNFSFKENQMELWK